MSSQVNTGESNNRHFWSGIIRRPRLDEKLNSCYIYEHIPGMPRHSDIHVFSVHAFTHEECRARANLLLDILNFHLQYIPELKKKE